MNPSNAALLAVATLVGLFVLGQSDVGRASAISLRGRHGKHPIPAFAGPSCPTNNATNNGATHNGATNNSNATSLPASAAQVQP